MNMPGFTAETSLYMSSRYYRSALPGQGSMINNPKIQGCWTGLSSSADQLYISEYMASRTIIPSACPHPGTCPPRHVTCYRQHPETGCQYALCCPPGSTCCPEGSSRGCANPSECCEDCSKFGKVCVGGRCICPLGSLQKDCGTYCCEFLDQCCAGKCCPFHSRCTQGHCVPNLTFCPATTTPCGVNCCSWLEHCCSTLWGNICCPLYSYCTPFGCSGPILI